MSTDGKGDGHAGKVARRALARVELTRALGAARSPRERLDALLSAEDADVLLRGLPAEELFFLAKDLGLSDAREIVQMASPAQFRAFLDLDAWRRDKLDPSVALTWIRLARGDEDEERYHRKIDALDIEVLALLLKSTLKIHDLEEDDDPEVHGAAYRSPEGRYVVEFLVEGSDYVGVRGLLDDLYAEGPFRAARLLEAVRWELPTELEETAYRWRTGRMADLGFPELGEALSHYAYLDPDRALPPLGQPPPVKTGFLIARLAPAGRFLDAAAARVPEESRAIVEQQLVPVLNAAMVVEGVDPGDGDAVARVLAAARDTLSLGLEHAAQGDVDQGARLLVGAPLKRVFQVGSSLGLRLRFRAERLLKSGGVAFPGARAGTLFDTPLGETIAGLRRKRPLLYEAGDGAAPGALRALRDRADLARLERALAEAEQLAAALAGLGLSTADAARAIGAGRPPEALAQLRFSDLLLTACAHALLGEALRFEPLPSTRLDEWAARALVVSGGQARPSGALQALVREALEGAARGVGEGALDAARAFADLCLRRVEEEAGAPLLAAGRLDPAMPLPLVVG